MSDWKAFSLFLVLMFAGCGSDSAPTTASAPATAKVMLKGIAESGEPIGRERDDLRQAFEQLKATDGAKGEKLLKQLDELSALSHSPKIRAKASAMASQL